MYSFYSRGCRLTNKRFVGIVSLVGSSSSSQVVTWKSFKVVNPSMSLVQQMRSEHKAHLVHGSPSWVGEYRPVEDTEWSTSHPGDVNGVIEDATIFKYFVRKLVFLLLHFVVIIPENEVRNMNQTNEMIHNRQRDNRVSGNESHTLLSQCARLTDAASINSSGASFPRTTSCHRKNTYISTLSPH